MRALTYSTNIKQYENSQVKQKGKKDNELKTGTTETLGYALQLRI